MFRIVGADCKSKAKNINILQIRHILSKVMKQMAYQAQLNDKDQIPFTKNISEQSSEAESIDQILHNLRKGYQMSKHSPNTDSAHSKLVYLSEDYKQLCWKSPGLENEKKIKMSSISRIGKLQGEQFSEHCPTLTNVNCSLAIISTTRSIWLQASDEIEREVFIYRMRQALRYARRMSKNYKYSEV